MEDPLNADSVCSVCSKKPSKQVLKVTTDGGRKFELARDHLLIHEIEVALAVWVLTKHHDVQDNS